MIINSSAPGDDVGDTKKELRQQRIPHRSKLPHPSVHTTTSSLSTVPDYHDLIANTPITRQKIAKCHHQPSPEPTALLGNDRLT